MPAASISVTESPLVLYALRRAAMAQAAE